MNTVTGTRLNTQLRTFLLLAGLTGLLVAIGGVLFKGPGLILFALIAVVMNFGAYWFSDRMALKMSRAEPLAESDDPRLYAIVRDLAQRAELPMPRLYLIPQEQPNAFATGRNASHAAIAVTAGLRRHMPEDQLAGVLAHELAARQEPRHPDPVGRRDDRRRHLGRRDLPAVLVPVRRR